MYSNHYDEAAKGFQVIATEKNSPWHDIAPYLVARTLLRRATLDVPPEQAVTHATGNDSPVVREKMQAAADSANQALRNQPNGPFALQLQARLSQMLSKPAPDDRFYAWLWDYTWLLDRRDDAMGDYRRGDNPEVYAKFSPERQKDSLTDWIVTFQMQAPAATEHALQLWFSWPSPNPNRTLLWSPRFFLPPTLSQLPPQPMCLSFTIACACAMAWGNSRKFAAPSMRFLLPGPICLPWRGIICSIFVWTQPAI